jgi:chemotaxis response regulator CheB
MPKAAAEMDAAAKILPVTEMASLLINFAALPTRKLAGKPSV